MHPTAIGRITTTFTFCLFFTGLPLSKLCAETSDNETAPKSLREAFTRHCANCHGDTKPKANLHLDALSKGQWRDYDLLDQVLTRIEDGEMPPKNAKSGLTEDQRRQLTALLKKRLTALENAKLPGTLNRLTRREWCYTLQDLTGIEVERPSELPIDSTHPMTRLGEHQLLTPLALRQYLSVANRYVDKVIIDTLPEVKTRTIDYTKAEHQIGNSSNEARPYGIQSHNDSTRLVIRSPVTSYALEGVYEIRFHYYHTRRPGRKEKGTPKPVAVDRNKHFGRFGSGGELLSKVYTHDLDGKKLHPSGKVEFCRFDQPLLVRLTKENKLVTFRVQGGGAIPWVFTSATVRGPLNKSYPASHQKIFGDAPRDGDLAACQKVLDSLGTRLFRRPVNSQIMTPYYNIAKAELEAGGNLFSATKRCMKPMLCSPLFLFRDQGTAAKLEDRMIATRLAYFLSSSAPDAQLMRLAKEGKLADATVRRAEAERLLEDEERTSRFVRLFVHQWLGLSQFDDFAPNAAYIDGKRLTALRPSIEREPYEFFTELLKHNLSARNLIDSDFVVWDKTLADYYGGKDIGIRSRDLKKPGFQKVDLSGASDKAAKRLGGVVTMPAIMSMTTDGETTQPILRGAWVVKHLFGKELTPPDSVPSLEIDLSNVDKPRDILRLHKQDPSCFACHVKMDYVGLSLENYDVMGRWQSNYLFPVIEGRKFKLVTKDPVDSLAESPTGDKVNGIVGLKKHLLQREDEILSNLVEKLFAYALGREVRYADRRTIARFMKDAKANDYRLRDLILNIVASDSFMHR